MVSFSVYPSWHLMRQAALDPAKSAKCRKARLISWMTRGPRKTCNDWSIGLTPTKWPKKLTDSLQGDGKNAIRQTEVFFVRSPTRQNFLFEILGGWGACIRYRLPKSEAMPFALPISARSEARESIRSAPIPPAQIHPINNI